MHFPDAFALYSEQLGMFVVAGNKNSSNIPLIITSPDGITWTERVVSGNTTLWDVAYSEILGMFVIAGHHGAILTSMPYIPSA
jgi:hypothetical protein